MRKSLFVAVCSSVLLLGAGCSTVTPSTPAQPVVAPQAVVPVPTPTTPTPTPTSAGSVQQTVSISGFSFQPSSMNVKVGDTVTWTNQDPTTHTVTADDGSFDSGNIASATGGTYSHTFTTVGTFSYHCAIHPSMKGTVVVE